MTPSKPSTPAVSGSTNPHRLLAGGSNFTARIGLPVADAFAYSSGLAAAVGAALTLVASRAFDAPDEMRWIFLVTAGTFIIYNVDRLRDLERDRITAPSRTAFILRNRKWLYAGLVLASSCFAAVLWGTPPRMILLCLIIGLVGLFHRRIKEQPALKALYVSVAWTAACVGLPWLASREHPLGPWITGVFLACLAANLIVSNLRDNELMTRMRIEGRRKKVLWAARGLIVLAIGGTLLGPDPLGALVWVPVSEGLALIGFRPTERYSHLAVDGGLFIGALVATFHLAMLS
jgi:hypothetical protein